MSIEIINEEYWEYKEGTFELTSTSKKTDTIDIANALINLRKVLVEINRVPGIIKDLTEKRNKLIKSYNDGVELLEKAREKYNLEELVLPWRFDEEKGWVENEEVLEQAEAEQSEEAKETE